MDRSWLLIAAAGVGVGMLAAVLLSRMSASGVGQGVGAAVVDAGAGGVVGIGSGMGIPPTDAVKCQADIAAGRMWEASFSCPAGTFLKAWLG